MAIIITPILPEIILPFGRPATLPL